MELALLLRSAARTATASQITKHGRSDAHAHPATAPTQAQPAGGGQPNIQTSARAVAALGPATTAPSARRLRPRSGAERSDGPSGCLLPIPSVCAEERSGQRIRARDCLSEAQRSEFERDPAGREHRRLPEAKRRDADSGVAFSLVTFFWRSKRKLLRRRAHSPAPAPRKGMKQKRPPALTNKAPPATKTGALITQPPAARATAAPTPQTSNKSPAS